MVENKPVVERTVVERTVVERTVVERTVVETTSGGKHTSQRNHVKSDPDLTPFDLMRPRFNAAMLKRPDFFEN